MRSECDGIFQPRFFHHADLRSRHAVEFGLLLQRLRLVKHLLIRGNILDALRFHVLQELGIQFSSAGGLELLKRSFSPAFRHSVQST